MTISKNFLMFTVLATTAFVSVCSENQKNQFDAAEFLRKAAGAYENCSKKMEPLYNPVAIGSIALTSATLGLKKSIFLAGGVALAANSKSILDYAKEQARIIEQSIEQQDNNQDNNLEKPKA